jgi:hypothetical protein
VRRHLVALLLAVLVVAGGAGVAVANAPVRLDGGGPTSVDGTAATAVFELGGRTVRQVRYLDRGVLTYRFELRNAGSIPLTVSGLERLDREPRLFRYLGLRTQGGDTRFEVPAGGAVAVELAMRMHGCETLSARAGSFATEVALRTTRAGFVDETVTVALPEEIHTGSPREAFCPGATATSRPPG